MINWNAIEKVPTVDDVENRQKVAEAITYLKSTDWYIIRDIEVSVAIPDEVKKLRAEARVIISK